MENQILEAISHIKNVSITSPTAGIFKQYICKTLASNIDLSFVNKTNKQLIAKNKTNNNFKITMEPENVNVNQSNDEVQILLNDELNKTLDENPTTPQLVDKKELEMLIIVIIAILKRKKKKCGQKEVFNLVKDSLETGFTQENFNKCLGYLISNKSVKHSTINSRESLSLHKEETAHDDSNNNDDTIIHGNTISHDDICVLKEDFNSYQAKCITKRQSVKDAFLKKLSDIEQNLEKNIEKKEFDDKYEKLLNQQDKENFFLKDEIGRKDKIIKKLLDNFSNNYITSKNTEVNTQTDQQNINNIQSSTASSHHRFVISSEKENDKNDKKPNISQLNSKTCYKTHTNKNSNDNTKERKPLDQDDKRSESEEITDQSNPNNLHKKKTFQNYGWRINSKTFAWKIYCK